MHPYIQHFCKLQQLWNNINNNNDSVELFIKFLYYRLLGKVRKEESGHDISHDTNFGVKEAGMFIHLVYLARDTECAR